MALATVLRGRPTQDQVEAQDMDTAEAPRVRTATPLGAPEAILRGHILTILQVVTHLAQEVTHQDLPQDRAAIPRHLAQEAIPLPRGLEVILNHMDLVVILLRLLEVLGATHRPRHRRLTLVLQLLGHQAALILGRGLPRPQCSPAPPPPVLTPPPPRPLLTGLRPPPPPRVLAPQAPPPLLPILLLPLASHLQLPLPSPGLLAPPLLSLVPLTRLLLTPRPLTRRTPAPRLPMAPTLPPPMAPTPGTRPTQASLATPVVHPAGPRPQATLAVHLLAILHRQVLYTAYINCQIPY